MSKKKKRSYHSPMIYTVEIEMEQGIAAGSKVFLGGDTTGQPGIKEQPLEENIFELEF